MCLLSDTVKADSVQCISDRETGRLCGFGVVHLPGSEAQAAIAVLNGYEMNGRAPRINEAQEREPRPGCGNRY